MYEILEILKSIHPEYDFSESNDFISDGLLDSFDVIILVKALEEKFGISIDGADITPENFKNHETLTTFVKGYLNGNKS